MNTIHLTATELSSLIGAVLPFAGKDFELPVLNSVLIETDGKWLYATATDRFRFGVKRIAKRATEEDESTTWPEFRALVPLSSIKALLSLFKPSRAASRQGLSPTLSLAVDGDQLIAESTGGFELFSSSRFGYTLMQGQYPDVRKLLRDELAHAGDRVSTVGLNTTFLADYKHLGRRDAAVEFTMGSSEGKPIIIRDHDGFIGLLMPRRLMSTDPADRESWDDYLAEKVEPTPVPKAKSAAELKRQTAKKTTPAARKKPAAKKASVSA